LEVDLYYDQLKDNEFDLTVYVPTKGRPDNALRLQDQFYKTTSLNSRVVFILSTNDEKIEQYHDLFYYIIVSPDKPGFVSPLNKGYLLDRRSYYSYALGFMGDDHYPRTNCWDEIMVEELQLMQSGLVYGNDKLQEDKIPTQIAMTSDIPLALGFMTLPRLKHLYADNFWLDLGQALGRIKYLPDVVIEHLHPAAGKAQHDSGYQFSGDARLDQEDKRTYHNYLNNDFEADVKNVSAMIRRSFK
jgi:hypothetical protein